MPAITTSPPPAPSIGIVSVGALLIRGGTFTAVTALRIGQPAYFFAFYKVVETLDATLTGQKRTEAPYTISLKPVKLFVIHTPPGHDPKGLHLARRDSATATTETRSGTLQVTDPGSGDGPGSWTA